MMGNAVYFANFPPDHEAAPLVLQEIGGQEIVSIEQRSIYPTKLCYWNAASHVASKGGSIQYGWLIRWLPDVYIWAWHHAAWRLPPRGTLIDISSPGTGRGSGSSTFAPVEPSTAIDLSWPLMIPNKYIKLVDDPVLDEYCEAMEQQHDCKACWLQHQRDRGASWAPVPDEHRQFSGLSNDPTAEELKRAIQVADKRASDAVDAMRAKFGRRRR